jgi:protein-tyrosine phosphatase
MPTILFLCTGNYYRSRFAEALFNWHAPNYAPTWRAESRGLEPHSWNVGAISPHAIAGLAERGIAVEIAPRDPLAVNEVDLVTAERIIALKEAEHRAFLTRLFPHHLERVEFWHIHDIDCAEPAIALRELELAVLQVLSGLRNLGWEERLPVKKKVPENA